MPHYRIHEVDGITFADTLIAFNKCIPEWPDLQPRHFTNAFWWLVYDVDNDGPPVAFAGLTPFEPFVGFGYLKRAYVMPEHRGHGLQCRMLFTRELKARQLGWTHLISECLAENRFSAANFRKAGFELCEPEQRWGEPGSIYWIKTL